MEGTLEMKGHENPIEFNLKSPEGLPLHFDVEVGSSLLEDHAGLGFRIKRMDSGQEVYCQLAGRAHHDYLDFFAQLSITWGLRMPRNRQAAPPTVFEARYTEVLSENLAPGMIYGYGDPAVLKVTGTRTNYDDWYYLLSTSNDAPDAFPILRSRNLADWEFVGYVFPHSRKPAWAADGAGTSDFWAPEMHQVQNEFRVYFSARDKLTRELCIGMARASHPDGPFIPDPAPLLKGNVIDPHVYVQENSNAYLYWKEDNNDLWPGLLIELLYDHPGFVNTLFHETADQLTAALVITIWPWAKMLEPMERFQAIQIFIEAVVNDYESSCRRLKDLSALQPDNLKQAINSILYNMETPIFAQPLSEDGSSLTGHRTTIIKNDLPWEAHLVEGMWVTKQNKIFYLFYTGNDFSTSQYGIGVAIAKSPLGPFSKTDKPLLQSTTTWWAPGHPSVTTDPGGSTRLFMHAYFPGKAGYKQFRALLSVPVIFTPESALLKQ